MSLNSVVSQPSRVLFSNRNSRHSLLMEINPYQILAAKISRPDPGPVVLESTAEFDSDDDDGLRRWLGANFEKQNSWVPVTCGFVPPEGLLQRESIQSRKLAEPGYLTTLVREQYKIENPEVWKFQTLSQLEGTPVIPEGVQRPALICGVSHSDVRRTQQHLLDHRLLPQRLEMSILPLLGAISDYKVRRNDKRAAVVVVIEQEHTVAYILGKEGVHTPSPVRHGFASIAQAARKEFNLTEAGEVRARLHHADDELLLRATKFVRAIGRDLKPLVDSYEMTTGQPVGEIFCAYLPPTLAWIAEPLAQVVGRNHLTLDCPEWMGTVNLQAATGVAPLGQHWLGALSLVATPPGPKPDKAPAENDSYQGPWHFDCRLSAQLPSNDLIRRRFVTDTIAVTFAVAMFMFAFWQLYLGRSLSAEINYWEQWMADNQRQNEELKLTTRKLKSATERLDYAYTLMAAPYSVTDVIMALGRFRPASMQVVSIDSLPAGLVLHGSLRETSESARLTLNRYRTDLLKDPVFAGTFASIALTSFSRQDAAEAFDFELTFKLKQGQP